MIIIEVSASQNHLSELFTALLHKRLEKWSVEENVLPDNSLGFRKGLRTEGGIFILTTLLDKYAKRGKKSSHVLSILQSFMIQFLTTFCLLS